MIVRPTLTCSRTPTRIAACLVALCLLYFLAFRLAPAVHYRAFTLYAPEAPLDLRPYQSAPSSPVEVNLVVASQAKDDVAWTSNLQVPYPLRVIRYISDSATAEYRPPVFNIGREALMYFTYFHDFYDDLPDVSIMIHSHEYPWHAQPTHRQSMSFALSLLDMDQVRKRGYFNLKTDTDTGCGASKINTTRSSSPRDGDTDADIVREEPFLATAFTELFGRGEPVPPILAGPCCSQFAVSRATIRRVPRGTYKRYMDWLIDKSGSWRDDITGRVWEHLFPYLFLGVAEDCPSPRLALCRMYGICFPGAAGGEGDKSMARYRALWDEKNRLVESLATSTAFLDNLGRDAKVVARRRERIRHLRDSMDDIILDALNRGLDKAVRDEMTRALDW